MSSDALRSFSKARQCSPKDLGAGHLFAAGGGMESFGLDAYAPAKP